MIATTVLAAVAALQAPAPEAAAQAAKESAKAAAVAAYAERRSAQIAAERQALVEGGRQAGDPSRPFVKAMLSRAQRAKMLTSEAGRQKATETTSFITPAGPAGVESLGCKPVIQAPSGVPRKDGQFSGYRILADCDGFSIDVEENDYRQPLTLRVAIDLPQEAVNADFGPGRALARYYVTPEGEAVTVFNWTNDQQEVRLRATSDPKGGGAAWNARLGEVMKQVVAQRLASR